MMQVLARLFGKSLEDGIYVPSMDGPLHANTALDQAAVLAVCPTASDMVVSRGRIFAIRGAELLELGNGPERVLHRFSGTLTALAAVADTLVVAETGTGLHWWTDAGIVRSDLPPAEAACVTALSPLADGRVAYCVGSLKNPADHWRRDLLERGQSGVIGVAERGQSPETVATGLAWPAGIVELPDGRLLAAEAWRHRLIALTAAKGAPLAVLSDLPGYPGRITRSPTGDLGLAIFAPRRPQFEFVLSERGFREDMIATLPEEDWIAPSLYRDTTRPGLPIMQGEIRQMGVMKPWAPTASYGLVVRLNAGLKPQDSWHSRADGRRHGIISTGWREGQLLALSAATGEILALEVGA